MTIIHHEMLWRQFGATIDMFSDCLRDCADELWETRLWAGKSPSWVSQAESNFEFTRS